MLVSGTAGSVSSAVTKDSLLDPDSIGSAELLSEGSETAGVACASFQARSSSAVGSWVDSEVSAMSVEGEGVGSRSSSYVEKISHSSKPVLRLLLSVLAVCLSSHSSRLFSSAYHPSESGELLSP